MSSKCVLVCLKIKFMKSESNNSFLCVAASKIMQYFTYKHEIQAIVKRLVAFSAFLKLLRQKKKLQNNFVNLINKTARPKLFILSLSLYFFVSTDNFLVAWKRGIAIISAGTVKVTPDTRVAIKNGYSLEIRDAVPQDAGDYICQIATLEPREITHTVEILGKF